MSPTTPGLHHVTAIAGDPQRTAGFYVETLGLRFVKRIVNHDDKYTYYFYFGDSEGTPGTNITFLPWGERSRSERSATDRPEPRRTSFPKLARLLARPARHIRYPGRRLDRPVRRDRRRVR